MEYDFELQETFNIKIIDEKTITNILVSLQYAYGKILDFLREKNLFRFEDTETYNILENMSDEEDFFDRYSEYGDNAFEMCLAREVKNSIDNSFLAIRDENLLQDLTVDCFIEILDDSGKTLRGKIILSIAEIYSLTNFIHKFSTTLDKTNFSKNLTCKYYIKIKI